MPAKGGRKAGKPATSRKRTAPSITKVAQFPEVGLGHSDDEFDEIFEVSVELIICGNDQSAKKVRRLCEKYFRRLPNVVLSDHSSEFVIDISVILDDTGRFCLSHVIGAKVITFFKAFNSLDLLQDTELFDMFETWIDMTDHGMDMGPVEALEDACAHIAEKFHREYVAPVAEEAETMIDF